MGLAPSPLPIKNKHMWHTPSASNKSNFLASCPSGECCRSRLSRLGEMFFMSQYFSNTVLSGNCSSKHTENK